jgi:hypothetical protein
MAVVAFDAATGYDAVDGVATSAAGVTAHDGNTVTPPTVADVIARMWGNLGTT